MNGLMAVSQSDGEESIVGHVGQREMEFGSIGCVENCEGVVWKGLQGVTVP